MQCWVALRVFFLSPANLANHNRRLSGFAIQSQWLLMLIGKFIMFCCQKTDQCWILESDCYTRRDHDKGAKDWYWQKHELPKKNWAPKSQRDRINTHPKDTNLVQKDIKSVNVFVTSNVVLRISNSASNSNKLLNLLRRRSIMKRFVPTLILEKRTIVPSRSWISFWVIPKMSVRGEELLFFIRILSGVTLIAGRSATKLRK